MNWLSVQDKDRRLEGGQPFQLAKYPEVHILDIEESMDNIEWGKPAQ